MTRKIEAGEYTPYFLSLPKHSFRENFSPLFILIKTIFPKNSFVTLNMKMQRTFYFFQINSTFWITFSLKLR